MSYGMTIADFVQKVLYSVYGVRLDTVQGADGLYHAQSTKFQEIVMEGNSVIEEFITHQDWSFFRERLNLGVSCNPYDGGIQEFRLPQWVYKVCTGYNDAVRLHSKRDPDFFFEAPFTSPRSINHHNRVMHDKLGRPNARDKQLLATVIGKDITFNRRYLCHEEHLLVETDVIRYMEPLHICDSSCPPDCPKTYQERVFTEVPNPNYLVKRTAMRRAEFDPSVAERVQSLTDEAQKLLSAMRENDSAHTIPDMYETTTLGFFPVL